MEVVGFCFAWRDGADLLACGIVWLLIFLVCTKGGEEGADLSFSGHWNGRSGDDLRLSARSQTNHTRAIKRVREEESTRENVDPPLRMAMVRGDDALVCTPHSPVKRCQWLAEGSEGFSYGCTRLDSMLTESRILTSVELIWGGVASNVDLGDLGLAFGAYFSTT